MAPDRKLSRQGDGDTEGSRDAPEHSGVAVSLTPSELKREIGERRSFLNRLFEDGLRKEPAPSEEAFLAGKYRLF
jgi:hypothetical protein